MSRVGDVPVYAQRQDQVEAGLYNLWRRARLHFKFPMRLPVTGHEGVVLILEEDEWVCADVRQNDLPILAWVEFEDWNRDALHVPVNCKLNYYHFAASKFRADALASMKEGLEAIFRERTR